ncbi:peptide deformylase [Patescibacteria group bacterium]|nr:peptide deformylase [Patescibacteria group bacterium]MBU1895507.1 peptide deformylase [Patescibacteria group bacterium]
MLNIITEPNEILRKRSLEIDRDFLLKSVTQEFIKKMIPTMYDTDGIGLAAPQVGQNIRICVVGKEAVGDKDLILINPTWEKTSRRKFVDVEGCLSVPHTYGKVKRWRNIHVEALDEKGNKLSFPASNFFARVIQHEIDHLDGILFIDKAKGLYLAEEEEKKSKSEI